MPGINEHIEDLSLNISKLVGYPGNLNTVLHGDG